MDANQKIAICLSGGGFRATFFHLGLIRFLRRFGLLSQVTHIASVSGGSIIAAHLVLRWNLYNGTDDEYHRAEEELRQFGTRDVRGRILRRWLFSIVLPFMRFQSSLSRRTLLLEREYDHLFRNAVLRDLSPNIDYRPNLHIIATSFTTGNLSSFSSEGFWRHTEDARKLHHTGVIPLALAVASSSAFPPLFPPTAITRKMLDASYAELPYDPEYLTDGGIFDNLGFAAFSRIHGSTKSEIDYLILSDAGAQLDWNIKGRFAHVISRTIRSTDILMQRVADHTTFTLKTNNNNKVFHHKLSQLIVTHDLTKPLPIDLQKKLARIRTDLDRFSDLEINCLSQHGETIALLNLATEVEDHPDFNRLASECGIKESRFDFSTKKLPALVRELDKSRIRRLGLFDARDWMSYLLFGYLMVVMCIAFFPYIYVARRAVEGDRFWSVMRISFATDRKLSLSTDYKPPIDWMLSNENSDKIAIGAATIMSANRNKQPPEREDEYQSDDASRLSVVSSITFNSSLGEMINRPSKGIAIYIPGFNTTFSNALLQAASIARDAGYKGQVIAYSWPSSGLVTGYFKDQAAAAKSAESFVKYAEYVRDSVNAPIDVIARGMGSILLFDAVEEMRRHNSESKNGKLLGQVIFVTPDIDSAVFVNKINLIRDVADHVAVIVSPNSVELLASSAIGGAPRAGNDFNSIASVRGIDILLLSSPESWLNARRSEDVIGWLLQRRELSTLPNLSPRGTNEWEFAK